MQQGAFYRFKYDISKKKRATGTKGSSEVKEMWFKPFIDIGDMQHKLKRVEEFVSEAAGSG